MLFQNCLFEGCGQPDVAFGGLHYDNMGGGDWTFAKVYGCSWENSSGAYVDFSAGTSGKPCRIIFIGNTATDHQIGGIYGLGERSIVANNTLINANASSGIGYDATTHADNRIASSIVCNNILVNLIVNDDVKIKSWDNFGAPTPQTIEHHTAADTLTKEESGSVHTNLGAGGNIKLTLPQDAVLGTYFEFAVMTDAKQLQVDAGAAGAIYINGTKSADDAYIWADDEAESVKLVADGNGDWIAIGMVGTWTVV